MKSETYAKIIRWGSYLCLLLPLFISRQFYFPFVFPRTAIFRMIIEILFILWLILVLKDKKYLPPKNAVFWSLAVLAGFFILTTFTSVDPAKSFLGSMERGSGVFTWLHYFGFFIILTSIFQQKKDWINFFNFAVGTSALVSLYALAQRLGLPSVYESGIDRATGTIGNAAFLASYLILATGLALFLLHSRDNFNKGKIGWKIFYYSIIVLNIFIIYLTGTRGAVLGLIAGFFIFTLLYIFFAPGEENRALKVNRVKKYLVIALVIIIVSGGFLWMFKNSAVVKSIPGLGRLAAVSIKEATAQTRILAWNVAWQGWKEKFLLGWGPENFNIIFNRYSGPEFYKYGGGETWFDKAHNIILDTGSTSGAAGLLAYLAVFGAAFHSLWKIKKREFFIAILLASVLAAYFFQNLLLFDVFNSYLFFFVILAFISFLDLEDSILGSRQKGDKAEEISGKRIQEKRIRKQGELGAGAVVILIILSLILFIFFWQYNYKPLEAAFWSAQAFKNSQQPQAKTYLGDSQKADEAFNKILGLYKKTFSFQTYGDPEMRTDFISFVFSNTENKNISLKSREKGFEFAADQARQSVRDFPLNARWFLLEAKILEGWAQLKSINKENNSDLLKEAEAAVNKGVLLAPSKLALQYIFVQTLLMQEKSQQGLEKARSVVSLYPEMSDSYWYLALAYIAMDDETSALKSIDQGLDYGYNFQNIGDLKLAVTLLIKYNDFQGLEKVYSQAIKLEPKNLQWYASLATVYSKLGRKEEAIETANKIIEIDPDSRPDVEAFIKGL